MKRFLYLFFSEYKWVRKYLGGNWVRMNDLQGHSSYWVWLDNIQLAEHWTKYLTSDEISECETESYQSRN